MLKYMTALITSSAMALGTVYTPATTADGKFGPSNPFYASSTLPFHAPPFDKIKDSDYQPAIEAGMAEQRQEMRAIADNPAAPTFENTLVAMEKTGQLFSRVMAAFNGVTGANLNPELQKVQDYEAPRLAAHQDAIFLDSKLFHRVEAVYQQRDSLKLDPEALRLVEFYHQRFVHSGANLSDSDKTELVFRDKHVEEVQNYAIVGQTLWILSGQRARKIPLTELDIPATKKANDNRGVDFQLPG